MSPGMSPCSCDCRDCEVPVPPMIPNFLAFQNRPEPPEAPAASAAARLLAEVPVFKAEKKYEVGTPGDPWGPLGEWERVAPSFTFHSWCQFLNSLQVPWGTWKEPCVVCREDIRVGQMCRRLPCLHLFHRECIDQWIAVKAGSVSAVSDLRSAKTFQNSMFTTTGRVTST